MEPHEVQKLDLLEFADETTYRLWKFSGAMAGNTSNEKEKSFCRQLATNLFISNEWLAQQTSSVLKDAAVRGRIENVLKNLERLCSWAPSPTVGPGNPQHPPLVVRPAGTQRRTPNQAEMMASGRRQPLTPNRAFAGKTQSVTPKPLVARSSTSQPGRTSAAGSRRDGEGQTTPAKTYPGLACLLLADAAPPTGIRNFAQLGKKSLQVYLIQVLEKFTKHDGKAKKQITVVRTGGDEDNDADTMVLMDDYTKQLQSLYALIKQDCVCLKEKSKQRIIANIHLKTSEQSADSQAVFRIMFLDHPHKPHASQKCQWQDTEIKFLKTIAFADHVDPTAGRMRPQAAAQPTAQMRPQSIAEHVQSTISHVVSQGRLLAHGARKNLTPSRNTSRVPSSRPELQPSNDEDLQFCGLIGNREMTQLSFEVSKGKIQVRNITRPKPSTFKVKRDSVALKQLLNAQDFLPEQRLLLSYLLAEAVWKFYSSDWMQQEWTKNALHFMYESSRNNQTPPGIFVDQPFLQADFSEVDDRRGQYRFHGFPKILALGIMLMEMELQIEIEDFRAEDDITVDNKPTVNADYHAAVRLSKEKGRWGTTRLEVEKKRIIDVCLTPNDFEGYVDDIKGQREQLWSCVVEPLKKLYEASSGGRVELDPVMALDVDMQRHTNRGIVEAASSSLVSSAVIVGSEGNSMHMSMSSCTSEQSAASASLFDDRDYPVNEEAGRAGVHYLNCIKDFNDKCILRLAQMSIEDPAPWQRPVRVAILDSGLNLAKDSFLLKCDISKRIVEKHSWVGSDCHDNFGHGTYVAHYFLKVAPRAELYVGKICDGKDIPSDQYKDIADAIDYATYKWDVDIISLSFGMDEDDEGIAQAIGRATSPPESRDPDCPPKPPKIVFAAASNGGPIENVRFPARMKSVITVNASDGHGDRIKMLSPSDVPGEDNFITLGAYARFPPYQPPAQSKPIYEYKCGTSFATPIIAALAADLLEFARFELNMTKRQKEWLYSRIGISSALKLLSGGGEKYLLPSPWLIPSDKKGMTMRDWVKCQLNKAITDGL